MFPSTRKKYGYACKNPYFLFLLPSVITDYEKDEGRIFRDRSGGKLTTWIPRGVCQLYPYFPVENSRSQHRRKLGERGVQVGSSRFTRWRRRGTRPSIEIIVVDETKCKYEEEEEERIWASCISKCYAFENQPFRSTDSCYRFSLPLFFPFLSRFFSIHPSTYPFFHDSIILTSTMKPTISPCREKIFEKNLPILIFFFFLFWIRPKEKWEGKYHLICIFLRI